VLSVRGGMDVVSVERLRDVLRSAFWFVPALCVVAAIGLAIGLVLLDEAIGDLGLAFLFPGPPAAARSLLSSVIQAMIAFTGLVFSITMVVLVLTSSQFSPRVLRTFLRDRTIQWALGIFVATFVYAIVVARNILGTSTQGGFVPRLAVTVALLLVLISVGVFIHYIDHVANMVRAASIITAIGDETRAVLERRCPPSPAPPPAAPVPAPAHARTHGAPAAGVLVSVNEGAVVRRAAECGYVVELLVRVGDYVPQGAPLVRLHPAAPAPRWLWDHVALASERTTEQDIAFGFRQLVDIAERALSPAVNDPTTACQSVDVLHDLLRRLATRPLPTGRHTDQRGRLRLVVPQYGFADYVTAVVGEIWRYGSDAAQVPQRLAGMLRDLRSVVETEHHNVLDHWLDVVAPPHRHGEPDGSA